MSITPDTKIIRSKRKTLALTVTPDATIIVKAPLFTPMFFINRFIKQNENWIQNQLLKLQQRPRASQKRYQNGETFFFLGMQLQMETGNYKDIAVQKDKLLFPEFLLFRAQKQLISWYKKQAKEIITRQVDLYAAKMQTSYTGLITFSDTKSQWGRCSHDDRLQFSWRLIMAPLLTLNYVVIHELAHTFEKNHSRAFWQIVRRYCPSYNRQRKWLKENAHLLTV